MLPADVELFMNKNVRVRVMISSLIINTSHMYDNLSVTVTSENRFIGKLYMM